MVDTLFDGIGRQVADLELRKWLSGPSEAPFFWI